MLSSIFDSSDNINILTQRFLKKLDGCIKSNFKKVRINNSKPCEQEKLYTKMRELKTKEDAKSAEELKKVVEDIAKSAEAKYNLVVEELDKMKPEGGKINSQKFWKLKKKLNPKVNNGPSAMFDKEGTLLTSSKAIEERALEVYINRLKPNKIEDHLESYEETENKLCELRLKLSKLKVTEPWTMDDLTNAIKDLDNGKARDALGHANELIKCAGSDFKLAILKFMNHMKREHEFPEALQVCNITSLYKHKGSYKDFNNYCCVFLVTVFQSILDKLIYNG